MAKAAEYRDMESAGLEGVLGQLKRDLFDLKFQASLSKLENVSLIRHKRRDIARAITVLHQRRDNNEARKS